MPHSGGGGSHGGGSHGGGHSRGGGGSSAPRYSKTYFPGSNRYIYYYHNRPCVYYSRKPYNPRAGKGTALVFGLFWMFISLFMLFSMVTYKSAGPLPLNYDSRIVIDDQAGMIKDTTSLINYLEDFKETTGISVCVETRNFENAEFGNTTENQAYNAYVSRWDDEKHWLIYYVGNAKDRSDDWTWNLMCGDECVSILDRSQEEKFTDRFHRYLVSANNNTFEDCIMRALSELDVNTSGRFIYKNRVSSNGNDVSGQPVSVGSMIGLISFVLIGLIISVISIIGMLKKPTEEQKAKMNAFKDADPKSQVIEDVCEYCGGIYVVGTVINCPHCAAPLKPHNQYQNN